MKKYLLICLLIFVIITNLFSQALNPGIILTFDDAYINEWYDILPILDQYDAKATFFISDMAWIDETEVDKLIEIYNNGHEIGGHGFAHLDGPEYLQSHTEEEYVNVEILPMFDFFSEHSIEVKSFAYPYGRRTSQLDALLLNYFDILRAITSSWPGFDVKDNDLCYIFPETIDNDLIYGMHIDHNSDNDYNELTEAILRAKNEGLILVFYAHNPSTSGADYTIRPSFLDSILAYTYSLGISFYRVYDIRSDLSLSIGLSSFTASTVNDDVLLNWSTASEINNLGFEVWRSSHEKSGYQMLDSYIFNNNLKGAGTSPELHNYSYSDNSIINDITYWYKLIDVDYKGVFTEHGPISIKIKNSPDQFTLYQNYPNPFNPKTMINYQLPMNNEVELSIYNLLGQKVATLVNEKQNAGYYQIEWDASGFASGIYYYRLEAGEFQDVKKMALLR